MIATVVSINIKALLLQENAATMADNGEYHASDSLLPGHGYTPDYGINQSISSSNSCEMSENTLRPSAIKTMINCCSGDEQWWKVAMCSVIACLASVVSGMVLGFSSPALTQLQFNVSVDDWISDNDVRYSLFGVRVDLQLST